MWFLRIDDVLQVQEFLSHYHVCHKSLVDFGASHESASASRLFETLELRSECCSFRGRWDIHRFRDMYGGLRGIR